MTKKVKYPVRHYLMKSRILTHVIFWIVYYIAFSFLWVNESNYYRSFGLEFVLMPIRISASYLTMYYIIPQFLLKDRLVKFLLVYSATLIVAGILQSLFTHFFHDAFFLSQQESPWGLEGIVRSMVLVNSTVLFLSAVKMYYYWRDERDKNIKSNESLIEIRADKRTYRINPSDVLYIEGLGNYATFYLNNRKPLISYTSLKEVEQSLPDSFVRIHKSFVINKNCVDSYTVNNVEIDGRILPIGKSIILDI